MIKHFIYVLAVIIIAIISCNNKDKKDNPKGEKVPDIIKVGDTITKSKQTTENDFDQYFKHVKSDPIFYIDGQLCQHLREIFQGSKGNLWFGTNVYGLMRYNGDRLEYLDEKDGIGGGRITGILEDKEGNVWFGTYKGLTKYDGKTFTTLTEKEGLLDNEIWNLLIDSKGVFWIATVKGLSRFDGKTFRTIATPKAPIIKNSSTTVYGYDRITSIIEDKEGIIWMGTDGFGINKYDGESITHITTADGLPSNQVNELLEDSSGNIWIGSHFGGISKYDGKTFNNYTQDGIVEGIEVGSFYEDKEGGFWFSSEHVGVYRYDGTSFTKYNMDDGLNTGGVISIYQDKEERFWFGGWEGLFRFDGKTFVSVTEHGPWD